VLLRRGADRVDTRKLEAMFAEFDTNGDGDISIDEFKEMMIKLGLAPLKEPARASSSRAKHDEADVKEHA